jgi:hypothetical protein
MKRSLRTLIKAGVAVSALAAGSLVVPTQASAQEIDIDFCTNFYPELCMGEDGEIDAALFPWDGASIPGLVGESTYVDGRYSKAVDALARHRAGDDLDGNGIPDSPEIAVCGEAGCLDDWAATAEVTEPDSKVLECCDDNNQASINRVEVDISEGMNQDKLVSVFTLSTPVVHYVGSYPEGGKVEVRSDPPKLEPGVHRIVAVGTADGLNEPEIKVWRLDVVTETHSTTATTAKPTTTTARVAGTSQSASARTTARTGANVGSWVMGGSALLVLGSALMIGARRRRNNV